MRKRTITFITNGIWRSEDMVTFLNSVTNLYNAIFALEIKRLEVKKRADHLYENIKKYYHYYDKERFKHILHLWKKLLKELGLWPSYLLPNAYYPIPLELSVIFKISALEIYQNINLYIYEDQKLYIRRIKMGSPGLISLTGEGLITEIMLNLIKIIFKKTIKCKDPRKEIEYNIKQLEYKIRKIEYAEKLKGLFEMFDKNSDIAIDPEPENEFLKVILENLDILGEFKGSGKVADITPEEIE